MVPGTYTPMFMNTGGSIQFIGEGGRFVRDGNGDLTVGVHPNTQVGDFVFLVEQYDQDSSVGGSPPTGWTLLANDQVDTNFRWVIIYRIYAGTPPTVTLVSGGDQLIATCLTFRGVDASTPIDSTGTVNELFFSAGTMTLSNHETTTRANCYHVDVITHDYNSSSSSLWSGWANSSLESCTELVEYSTTTGWDGGFAVAGGIKRTAGLVADTTLTSSINKRMGAYSFALRPE